MQGRRAYNTETTRSVSELSIGEYEGHRSRIAMGDGRPQLMKEKLQCSYDNTFEVEDNG